MHESRCDYDDKLNTAIGGNEYFFENRPLFPILLEKYRDVIFSSLVTSFALDAVLFRNDQENGHVDTNHNVLESWKKTGKPVFKSEKHSKAYEARGEYDSTVYHDSASYKNKGREWNEARDAGKLVDSYTGKPIAPGEHYDRDHVIAAKIIHDDPRAALSGLDRVELANQDSNLRPTNRSINRSKSDDTVEGFIERLAKQREENRKEAEQLRDAIKNGSAPDGAHKRLESLEAKLSVVEKHLREAAQEAERAQSRSHDGAYYMSGDFLGTTSGYALAAGCRMGAKQGLGIILLELSASVQEELPAIMRRWEEMPTWREKLDPRPILEHVATALKNAWERVRNKLGHLWNEVKDGFSAGVLSEIVTTIINIFTGTAKRIMRLLRNFWSAIVSSLRILIHNPDNLGPEEKLAAVMRLFSVAVGGIIQPLISEVIDKFFLTYAAVLPGFLREALAEFAGAAIGGIISVTLVYAIDNSPIVRQIIAIVRKAGAFTEAVYQQIAQIAGTAWRVLKSGVEEILEVWNSPAVNLLTFVACPPMSVAFYVNRRFERTEATLDRVEQGGVRIENKLDMLGSDLAAVERLVRDNGKLLRCVIDGQERQMKMLAEIRKELRAGFEEMRVAVQEGAEFDTIQRLQENLNELLFNYRNCAALLSQGGMPLKRDLERIETLASSLIGKFQARFNAQKPGAPARLPLLTGMVFALGTWRDARNVRCDGLEMCFQHAFSLVELARGELRALTENATLWELAQESSWLIGQYVLLCRTLAAMPSAQTTFELDLADGYVSPAPSFTMVGWDDGLQNARNLIADAREETPLLTLPLKTFDDRNGWLKLTGLPGGTVVNEIPVERLRQHFGIPDEVTLGISALELIRVAPGLLEENRSALSRAFS